MVNYHLCLHVFIAFFACRQEDYCPVYPRGHIQSQISSSSDQRLSEIMSAVVSHKRREQNEGEIDTIFNLFAVTCTRREYLFCVLWCIRLCFALLKRIFVCTLVIKVFPYKCVSAVYMPHVACAL